VLCKIRSILLCWLLVSDVSRSSPRARPSILSAVSRPSTTAPRGLRARVSDATLSASAGASGTAMPARRRAPCSSRTDGCRWRTFDTSENAPRLVQECQQVLFQCDQDRFTGGLFRVDDYRMRCFGSQRRSRRICRRCNRSAALSRVGCGFCVAGGGVSAEITDVGTASTRRRRGAGTEGGACIAGSFFRHYPIFVLTENAAKPRWLKPERTRLKKYLLRLTLNSALHSCS
jgi:hypothetical protein